MTTPPTAVVAGGSRGLGLLVCRELARRGHVVHACARDETELEEARRLLDQEGLTVHTSPCDVRDAAAVRAWIDGVGADGLDVAIHVAGIIQVLPARHATSTMYQDAVDTMLLGPVHLADAVLDGMLAQGHGRLGIVSSVGGVVAPPRLLPYAVAKFGATGLAEGLYSELAGTGVSCTAIIPGLMRTGSHQRARFLQQGTADYRWFAAAASLPGISMSADRAARRIVEAVLAGRPRVELTPLTWLAQRVHGLAPATTTRALGVVARCLPEAASSGEESTASLAEGITLRRRISSRMLDGLTRIGDRAADAHNEHVGTRGE